MEVQEQGRCASAFVSKGVSEPVPVVTELASAASDSLLGMLSGHGNRIGATHERALRELLGALAAQALGVTVGRRAYALPCGAGKTLGVVALISTARRLGLPLSFAVATSQVAALARLRRDLVRAGVRPADIALRHSKTPRQLAELVSDADDADLLDYLGDTGAADSPILLLSHARVRRGEGCRDQCWHHGKPRSLMIWDESLFLADAETLFIQDVSTVCEVFGPALPPHSAARRYFASIGEDIKSEIARQRAGGTPTPLLLLPDAGSDQISAAIASLPSFGSRLTQETRRAAQRLLRMAERPLSVALTGAGSSGEGLIRYSIAVPSDLENIAVLDASHQVRLLAQGQGITDATTEAMRSCKRYDLVQVNEYPMSAGKSTLKDNPERRQRLAREVAALIRQIPADEPVLVFTFKGDEDRLLHRQLKNLISEHGIDLGQVLNGKPRICWLTWGSETSLNAFSHCKHVILCGVVRRSHLDLAASVAGREGDLALRMSTEQQRRLQLSEMCHCVLQAMSRGACRISDEQGQAKAMTLSIYGTVPGMRAMLAPSVPGVRWHTERPVQAETRTGTAARRILEYLDSLPDSNARVSVSSLKKALVFNVGSDALTTAVKDVVILSWLPNRSGPKWRHEGRSLVRD